MVHFKMKLPRQVTGRGMGVKVGEMVGEGVSVGLAVKEGEAVGLGLSVELSVADALWLAVGLALNVAVAVLVGPATGQPNFWMRLFPESAT